MASSRDTSNGPDVQDVTCTLLAFEAINQVRLGIRFARVDDGKVSTLSFVAEAWSTKAGEQDQKPLASVTWKVASRDRRTMDALIMQLIYKLDAELAASEMSLADN